MQQQQQRSNASVAPARPAGAPLTVIFIAALVLFLCLPLQAAAQTGYRNMRADGEQLELLREMSQAVSAAAPLETLTVSGFRVEVFHAVPEEYTRAHVRDVPENISLDQMRRVVEEYSATRDTLDDDLLFYTKGKGYGDLPIGYAYMDVDEPYACKPVDELGPDDGAVIALYMDNYLAYRITATVLVTRGGQSGAVSGLLGRRIIVSAKVAGISEDGTKADFTVAIKDSAQRAEIGCSLSVNYDAAWIADDDLNSVRPGDMLDISGILRSVDGYNIGLGACLPYTYEDDEDDEDY